MRDTKAALPPKKLRVGVIGVGAMGRNHIRVYSELPDVHLVGIADTDEKLLSQISEAYHVKPFTDYRRLLSEDLDAVTVAVPTSLHRETALEAINAYANVLIEKPIADTLASAEAIIRKAGQKNIKLMVGHIERFNPSAMVLKNSLEGSNVISIDIVRVGPFPPRVKDIGVVVDLAIHDIDLIRFLTNSEFKKTYGLVSRNISSREDTAVISFEMANGVLAHITANWLTPFKVRTINAATREKFVSCWLIEQKVVEYARFSEDNSYIVKELKVPYAEPLRLELEAFMKCVRENTAPLITGEDGLKALKVAISILDSNR